MGQVERRCAVEDDHIHNQLVGVKFFINDEHLDDHVSAVGPIPLRPAVWYFNPIVQITSTVLNLEFTVNIAAINVKTCVALNVTFSKVYLPWSTTKSAVGARPIKMEREAALLLRLASAVTFWSGSTVNVS